MEGHQSAEQILGPTPSCASIKSDHSKAWSAKFRDGHPADQSGYDSVCGDNENPDSVGPEPSCLPIQSDRSMGEPDFKDENPHDSQRLGHTPSHVSCKSDSSKEWFTDFKDGQHPADQRAQHQRSEVPVGGSTLQHQTQLDSVIMLLKEKIESFFMSEMEWIHRVLSLGGPRKDEEVLNSEEEVRRRSSREAFLKITENFLRSMKQEDLADFLQGTVAADCPSKLKSSLKKKFQSVFEGIEKAGNSTLLNQIYTELYITEGGPGEVNDEHEVRKIETASRKLHRPETTIRQEDIFKVLPGRDGPIRTVMTKGVAGIGKTVLTQKFALDWAEGKTNQDIQFTFPFTFRELNVLREKKFSLVELVHHFFTEIRETGISRFEEFQVVFIFDGLDECRLPLDFLKNEILTDATESTSVDVLLTNLIKGNLLPSARLWITTRPAAANQIPPKCVDRVTEVRGFTDPQKEEYFRKRFKKNQANKIISHIKTSRSLHIMCHMPVFCWITATVLEDLLKTREAEELPKTLTEMYIHFLVVQTKRKTIKYDGGTDTDTLWSPESRKTIESLGKLAFEQLQEGNLIFYESDLMGCDIDISKASRYSGVFTQVSIEERGLYPEKVFCFVHLSVQEFLAAFHVHLTLTNSGVNLMSEGPTASLIPGDNPELKHLHQCAVDQALQSPNGHLDLFLRFLFGLSLTTNQNFLRGLLTQTGSDSQTSQETAQYIKTKISENTSAEKSINLFHFLSSQSSSLKELDMSNNDLEDLGLKRLCAGLGSPHCKLETLSLSGCLITEQSCSSLASALSANPSHLRELDLSYNHLGHSGEKLLKAGLEDPLWSLDTLRVDHGGDEWLKPGLQKYFCELTLDPNTAHRKLKLSENNRRVTRVEEDQPYSDHPDRFEYEDQLLCRNGLKGRCYWEVERRGGVHISVAYRGIRRKGNSPDCMFGLTDHSWTLSCSKVGFSVRHNNTQTALPLFSPSLSGRVAVYVDWPAGILSFYRVSSGTLVHIYTYNTTFTEPLYPGFTLWSAGTSVSL
ncbi:protein NLRC3-like isoform X3 [Cheilinus undulatus]|uniref:protein NLRC3-like isoform X3 n=1 Tax=Cheilinus undulatus TaxID=241271 RepID=UPI001BD528F0|nr:protein NLRC3-like isoform X3 [Cheilinus undulatus]